MRLASHNSFTYLLPRRWYMRPFAFMARCQRVGYWPYIMIYDKAHCEHKYIDLAGWVNNRYIFPMVDKFEDFNSSKKANPCDNSRSVNNSLKLSF